MIKEYPALELLDRVIARAKGEEESYGQDVYGLGMLTCSEEFAPILAEKGIEVDLALTRADSSLMLVMAIAIKELEEKLTK